MNKSSIILLLVISICLCYPVLGDEEEARSSSACEWRDAYCKDNYKKDRWATAKGCKWVLRGGTLYDVYYDATYHSGTSTASPIVSETREVERERETQWKYGGFRYQPKYTVDNSNQNNNVVTNNNQQIVSGNNNNVKNEVTNNNNQQVNSNNGNSIFNINKWCLFGCTQEAELDEAQLDEAGVDEATENKQPTSTTEVVELPNIVAAEPELVKPKKQVIPKHPIQKLTHHRRNHGSNAVKVSVDVNVN